MNTVQGGSGIVSKPPAPLPKPPHELEMDRKRALLSKVKAIRENRKNKGAVLAGDPAKEYCWVNTKDDRRISYEAEGWVVVKDPAVRTNWKQEDGTHKRADLILYEIDKELYEAMVAYNQLRGIEAVEQNDDTFLAFLERNNVPGYKPRA